MACVAVTDCVGRRFNDSFSAGLSPPIIDLVCCLDLDSTDSTCNGGCLNNVAGTTLLGQGNDDIGISDGDAL